MSAVIAPTELESGLGNTLQGGLRAAGFFLVVLASIPFQLLSRVTNRINSFYVSTLLYKSILLVLRFKVRLHGLPSTAKPTLFVSSHSSYFDVLVLGSVIPAAFVAKKEVSEWPFIGWLAKLQHTVFVERKSARAAEQCGDMRCMLEQGQSLILFPEGTSSDGLRTLPFKSSLFSIAAELLPEGQPVTVQPVSVVCTEISGLPIGRAWRPYYAWYGDMTFYRHLWSAFKVGHFSIDIIFHAPVTVQDIADRKEMARYCHRKVAEGVERCLAGRMSTENLSEKITRFKYTDYISGCHTPNNKNL